jgi:hypothetical protein
MKFQSEKAVFVFFPIELKSVSSTLKKFMHINVEHKN